MITFLGIHVDDDALLPQAVYRQFEGAVGYVHNGHKHTIDHVTVLVRGAISVKFKPLDGGPEQVREFKGPDKFLVKANVEHEFTVTEDAIWQCWFFSSMIPHPDIVDFWS